MSKLLQCVVCTLVLAVVSSAAVATADVVVDGSIGSDWAGVTPVQVTYDPGAPEGNFGAPTGTTDSIAYDIYVTGDANDLYVGLETTSDNTTGLTFTNLYFGNSILGSTIGFEIENNNAFVPGGSTNVGYATGTADNEINYAMTTGTLALPAPTVIEIAIPWAVFTENSLNLAGFSPLSGSVQLRLSQSFGYSVAGGQDAYGDARLGLVNIPGAVPEPASVLVWTLLGLTVGGVGWWRKRAL
ncbi:MAG TPA: hypothetical protein VGG64_19665 [Pirellulales bacterium]|jgi:hypothetical protein